MTGTAWIEESGFGTSPIMITNTHSVGLVRVTVIKWQLSEAEKAHRSMQPWSLPIVAEAWDGFLHNMNGFHVQEPHVFAALNGAKSGPVPEGSVGGGTVAQAGGCGRAVTPSGSWCNAIADGVRSS